MADEASANSLDRFDIFAGLTPQERTEVAKACRWKRYGAQEQIIDRQSENREVFFIVEGAVRVVIYSVSGRELTLDDLGPGSYFGEMAAIDGHPRSASVMSLNDTLAAILPAETFVRLVTTHEGMALNVMRRLTSIVRTATDRIIDLSTLGANNRVHAELLRQARTAGVADDGSAVLQPIPVHGDIASRVSTTRETVARVMNDLARQGIVKRERDSLVIFDVDRLEELVESVRGE